MALIRLVFVRNKRIGRKGQIYYKVQKPGWPVEQRAVKSEKVTNAYRKKFSHGIIMRGGGQMSTPSLSPSGAGVSDG